MKAEGNVKIKGADLTDMRARLLPLKSKQHYQFPNARVGPLNFPMEKSTERAATRK